MKRIHILGVGGTFMGGVALLAKQAGFRVSGSDTQVYPPMSTMLEEAGIDLREGYDPAHLDPRPDEVVVGNVMSRGNPVVEHLLDRGIGFISGPQWLYERVLRDRWVLAVAGTHGKTSTASMLAWIMDHAGYQPGFLIGGLPVGFGVSARLGDGACFVVEADEYDTAFFDKRSKFVHYYPRTLILNNLELDHADIFDDLAAIKRQFHHLVRIVPGNGLIVSNAAERALADMLALGCWTPIESFGHGGDWQARLLTSSGSRFEVRLRDRSVGEVEWGQVGAHNVTNALAAVAAAAHAGVAASASLQALATFKGVKRRLEVRFVQSGITVYDDFAHHPTAIEATLTALRAKLEDARIVAVVEPRSNTMRLGWHRTTLAPALAAADRVVVYRPAGLEWSLAEALAPLGERARVLDSVAEIVDELAAELVAGDHVVIMSNGGFDGLPDKLSAALSRERH